MLIPTQTVGLAVIVAAFMAGCTMIDPDEVLADPAAVVAVAYDTGGGGGGVSFSLDVQPIFLHYCTGCHQGASAPAGLDLTDYASIISKAVVVPGDAEGSVLYQFVSQGQMPPVGSVSLSDAELATLAGWIDEGALEN